MPRKTKASRPRTIAARLRGQQAIKLRQAGATLEDIARQLGFKGAAGAYKSVMRELGATAQDHGEGTEAVRQTGTPTPRPDAVPLVAPGTGRGHSSNHHSPAYTRAQGCSVRAGCAQADRGQD